MSAPLITKEALKAHDLWLSSGGKAGQRLNFTGATLANVNASLLNTMDLREARFDNADLRHASLTSVNLSRASLQRANLFEASLQAVDAGAANFDRSVLKKADLRQSNLTGATFRGANLGGANLSGSALDGVDFRDADLRDCNLLDAKSLSKNSLGGTNLLGTVLPEYIRDFDADLDQASESSKVCKKLLLSLLAGVTYTVLTIGTTKDFHFLAETADLSLPIVGSHLPVAGFYLAAPIILIAVYVYFVIYLQRHWELLASLPGILPNGARIDTRITPWLLNGLVHGKFSLLSTNRPAFSHMQARLAWILAYLPVPICLFLVWSRSLVARSLVLSLVQTLSVAVSMALLVSASRLATQTLESHRKFSRWKFPNVAFILTFASLLFLTLVVIKGSINGQGALAAGAKVLAKLRISSAPDLRGRELSSKPENYELLDDLQLRPVKGASLKAKDLHDADLSGAFLAKADLAGAKLSGARLFMADLREADLSGIDWCGADVTLADLRGATGLDFKALECAHNVGKARVSDKLSVTLSQ